MFKPKPQRILQFYPVPDLTISLQDLAKDPWVNWNDPKIQNPPLKDGGSVKFLINGAGHYGLLYACRLVEAGFSAKDIVCVDIAGGFGGTWYWNRYPGLMCDVESYIYLPLLEETGYMPKYTYSYGAEIRGQNERAAQHFGIQGQFCTRIESQIWDDDKKVWVVQLTRTVDANAKTEQLTVFADFVIVGGGVLNIPKVSKPPGWEDFRAKKTVFHSARWDYTYTGGNQEQPDLVNLKDKTVAIIGTGATSVQIIPELAKWAKHLYVVQRIPAYSGWRGNRLTDEEHFKDLSKEKGWQRARRLNYNAWVSNNPEGYGPNLVNDGWTHTPAGEGFLGSTRRIVGPYETEEYIRELHRIDRPRTEALRKRIDDVVKDKDTAEKLKPWYGSWCKRPTFHDDYLETFNQPNVTLIDTDGKGLQAFSENGLVFDGQEYKIDALVLATEFAVTFNGDGRNGQTMSQKAETTRNAPLFGIAVSGFPNLFSFFSRGNGTSWNLTSMYDSMATYVAAELKKAHMQVEEGKKVIIEATPEAEDKWGDEMAKRAALYSALGACTPTYFTGGWAAGPVAYQEKLESLAAKSEIEGFKVSVAA
ncbi:hypothetical protein COCMIDRAFT_38526 [Bipolaris oryzae ATCC 44560]|uniref:L-ornithine N(5)-oxygenase n=1 Tax=Bipolaris oryzae ATCC 44560 TaxID=930090 RepID=W6Z0N7_COCMI|nr:uncharacterized protein COCMIDRAFT_38526 [Bipolaris oryzae ATCC 44560]EUC43525.1 hypothetical protein COCMIDRAFT_38526 [Bipolaris oryzae ATCC 44560]